MKVITVHVSDPIYQEFQAYARRADRKTAELIREAMEDYRQTHIRRNGSSLSDFKPVSVGKVIQPLTVDDDILGEMIDAAGH